MAVLLTLEKSFARWCSLQNYYRWAQRLIIPLSLLTMITFSYGLIGGILLAPADYQQGDGFRIIYVHVPAAFLSLFVYMIMASCALLNLVFKLKLMDILVKVNSIIGASFTVIALITGAIWGKPMWGTWWIWDARLTSELILLFLYLGCIIVRNSFEDQARGSLVASLVAIFGAINVPVIHFSVQWWHTLHQGPTLSRLQAPAMATSMLYPLLVMIAAFFLVYLLLVVLYSQAEILQRDHKTKWVQDLIC